MADNLADSFVNSYNSMQSNQRANTMAEQDVIQRLAQQHFNEAKLAMDQQAQAYAQDPDNPENTYKAAQTDYYTNRLPAQEKIAQEKSDNYNRKLDIQQEKNDQASSLARVQGAIDTMAKEGTPASLAQMNLLPEDQPEFQKRIQAYQQAVWQAKHDSILNDKLAGIQAPTAANIGQGAATGAAQGLSEGNPLGAMFGAVGGAAQPVMDNDQAVAQAIYDTQKEAGPKPNPEDWQNFVHPAFAEKQQQDAAARQKLQADALLATNKAAREQERMQLDPAYLKLKQDTEADRQKVAQGRLDLAQKAEGAKELFNNGVLDVKKLQEKVNQQRADAESLKAKSYAWMNSKPGMEAKKSIIDSLQSSRWLAQQEYKNAESELTYETRNLDKIQEQQGKVDSMLANVREVPVSGLFGMGQHNETRYVDPKSGATRPLTKDEQAAMTLRDANRADLDPTNPTSQKARVLALSDRLGKLGQLMTASELDRQQVLNNGKTVPPGKSAPGNKGSALPAVGGMGSDRPVTRDEFNALPSGSRFLAPDGQYHIKP